MVTEVEAARKEFQVLKQWVSSDFGDAAEELLPLFLEPHSGRPLYLTHLPIVLRTLRVDYLLDSQVDQLNAAYVYLTSAFYSVDALADGHPQLERNSSAPLIATALPLLISAAGIRLQQAISLGKKLHSDQLLCLMHESLLELRSATKSEEEHCGDATGAVDFEREAFHLAGRSATIIFLFKAVGYLAEVEVDAKLLGCLRSILVAIQLGDDISDWRTDLAAGKWTPFLRQCSAKGARTSHDFEQLFLVDGAFEFALADVGKRLMTSLDGLPSHRYAVDPLKRFVDLQVDRVRNEIERAVAEKLHAGVLYEHTEA